MTFTKVLSYKTRNVASGLLTGQPAITVVRKHIAFTIMDGVLIKNNIFKSTIAPE